MSAVEQYPMCDKLGLVVDERNAIVEFLEWIASVHGARLCVIPGSHEWHPIFRQAQDLAHEFLGIDDAKLEAERRAMLEALTKRTPAPTTSNGEGST